MSTQTTATTEGAAAPSVVWLTKTVVDETGAHGPGCDYTCDADTAAHLIAIGFAVDPEQRIVVAAAEASVVATVEAERDALRAQLSAAEQTIADATAANEEFKQANDALVAQVAALQEQVAALQEQVKKLEKKAGAS